MLLKNLKVKIPLFLLIILNCASSEVYMRNDIDYSKYNRIAVYPLYDYPSKPGSGLQVADMISTQLINSNYNIIDRTRTMLLLQEHQLGMTGIIDEKSALSIGKMLGVQAILTGSINEYQSITTNVQLVQGANPTPVSTSKAGFSLKLIDCETGLTVWSGSAHGTTIGQNAESIAAQNAVRDIVEKFKKLNIGQSQYESKYSSMHDSQTLLPNFRSNYPKYDKYTDEQIIKAFRDKNPRYKEKSDISIIKYIEGKFTSNNARRQNPNYELPFSGGVAFNFGPLILDGYGAGFWFGKKRVRFVGELFNFKIPDAFYLNEFEKGELQKGYRFGIDYFMMKNLNGPYIPIGLEYWKYLLYVKNSSLNDNYEMMYFSFGIGYLYHLTRNFYFDAKFSFNASIVQNAEFQIGNKTLIADNKAYNLFLGIGINF